MKATQFHPQLLCGVDRVEYDFRAGKGTLYLPAGDCCDMSGCIAFFEAIDPKVQAIDTFSGGKRDTGYRRHGSDWSAALPQ